MKKLLILLTLLLSTNSFAENKIYTENSPEYQILVGTVGHRECVEVEGQGCVTIPQSERDLIEFENAKILEDLNNGSIEAPVFTNNDRRPAIAKEHICETVSLDNQIKCIQDMNALELISSLELMIENSRESKSQIKTRILKSICEREKEVEFKDQCLDFVLADLELNKEIDRCNELERNEVCKLESLSEQIGELNDDEFSVKYRSALLAANENIGNKNDELIAKLNLQRSVTPINTRDISSESRTFKSSNGVEK